MAYHPGMLPSFCPVVNRRLWGTAALAILASAGCASGQDAGASGGGGGAGVDGGGGNPQQDGSQEAAEPDAGADGSADASDAQSCVAKTCSQVGANCGTAPDGCNGSVECGACAAGQTCGGGGINQCGTNPCQAQTCSQLGASCGVASDMCGGVVDCGSCPPGTECGVGAAANQCACVCSLPHANTACDNGQCSIESCVAGFADCDGVATNGCETDLSSSASHCGACDHPCPDCQTCSSSACVGTIASCAGKQCGDDGCGGSCGTCGSGQACQGGTCQCDPALPSGWPSTITPWVWNPLLVPTGATANQGADNVYAPDIHDHMGVQVMFYGAQGADGHDRVYAAWSSNGMEWRKYPKDDNPLPVLDRGSSNHVNDPSAVRVGSTWRMYYTDAPTAENDRIWLAESSSLKGFVKTGEVLGPVAGTWEADKVGRPSVILDGGVYKMWYDGTGAGSRHVGFASSSDGVTFTRHAGNPIFLNAGAVDVKKVGGVYVMLREGGDGTYWATSVDGLCWVDRGKLFGLSGKPYDAFGQVTPFLKTDGAVVQSVWFGGASVATWNKNRIAVAFPAGAAIPSGGGCTACTTEGISCAEACVSAGGGSSGSCGAPGSTSPGACCSCGSGGCDGCMAAADCQAACVAAGQSGGWCGNPGSTDPGACCTCLP